MIRSDEFRFFQKRFRHDCGRLFSAKICRVSSLRVSTEWWAISHPVNMDFDKMRMAEVAPLRDAHPLDVIEAVAAELEWSFERSGEDELAVSVSGQLSAYTVSYSWMEDCEALHLACAFDMKVPRNRASEVARLVALINEQLLMGHFDFWQKENVIMFRQTLVLAGGLDPTERQVEALFDSAVETCDTYFAAFQFVVWSGLTGREAIETVLFETVGTA